MLRIEKSFESSEKATYWSIKNNECPRNVFKSSHKKFWFDCNNCSHSFEAALNDITNGGRWCPFCSNKRLCEISDCKTCLEKSFESSEKAAHWSIKNTEIPRNVFKSSNKKFWFDCGNCDHVFEITLGKITNSSRWCPYCSGRKLCEIWDCKTCLEKSFESSEKATYWSIKNTECPRNIFKSSTKRFWFDCNNCDNDFGSSLNNITNGRWCPFCSNKTELKLLEYLIELYPKVIHQAKFDWCMHTSFLPFDFYIPSKNLIIELDGPQHFIQVSNWQGPFKTQIKDAYKSRMARQNGYTVLRMNQEDVWYDKNDWKSVLKSLL